MSLVAVTLSQLDTVSRYSFYRSRRKPKKKIGYAWLALVGRA